MTPSRDPKSPLTPDTRQMELDFSAAEVKREPSSADENDASGSEQSEQPPPKLQGKTGRVALLLALLLVCLIVLRGGWLLAFGLDRPLNPHNDIINVGISRGDSLLTIADRFKQAGLLHARWPLVLLAVSKGTARRMQPGLYQLPANVTLRNLHNVLQRGAPIRVTFPEGYRLEQFAATMKKHFVLDDPQMFLELATTAEWIEQNTELTGLDSLEGYLWPDTYDLMPGDSPERLLKLLVLRFQREVDSMKLPNGPGALTLHDLLTLASMIEKETAVAWEKPLAASVYYNRLAKNMKLGCDATVRYGLEAWSRPLTAADLKTDTPYNTYLQRGLPPGPIASPGYDSLRAVLYPASTDYYYYCAKGNGTHAFARTVQEHDRNVQKYLRNAND